MKSEEWSTIKPFVYAALTAVVCEGNTGCLSVYARNYPDTHPSVYPGVRFDAGVISCAVTERHELWLWGAIGLVDIPFSVIFDTILLPYDAAAKQRYQVQYGPRRTTE